MTLLHARPARKREKFFTTSDDTNIYFNDWGDGQPIVFSHGWPLSAEASADQMFYLASRGYRCIAHDRRGHGRSSQTWQGNDLDTDADDLAELMQALEITEAIQVSHSTGGGEVTRYIGRHGSDRVSRVVLISAIPPVMVKGPKNPQTRYYGPSHTDSDIWVYFVEDVLSTGDTFWNGVYPFIDNENGGSIDGMIRAANMNIERAGKRTIVVPGHGPVGGRLELIEFRDMLVGIRSNIASLKRKGLSKADVVAAHPTAAFDAKWGGYVIDPGFITRMFYDGL